MATCPKCGGKLWQMNMLFIVSPAGWKKFDKKALRSKELRISGARRTMLWCDDCGYHYDLLKAAGPETAAERNHLCEVNATLLHERDALITMLAKLGITVIPHATP